MGSHWVLLTTLGFLLGGVVIFSLWWAYGRLVLFGSKYYHRYSRVPTRSSPASRLSPSFSPTGRKSRIIPSFFQRTRSKEDDEEAGSISKALYELVNRNARDS